MLLIFQERYIPSETRNAKKSSFGLSSHPRTYKCSWRTRTAQRPPDSDVKVLGRGSYPGIADNISYSSSFSPLPLPLPWQNETTDKRHGRGDSDSDDDHRVRLVVLVFVPHFALTPIAHNAVMRILRQNTFSVDATRVRQLASDDDSWILTKRKTNGTDEAHLERTRSLFHLQRSLGRPIPPAAAAAAAAVSRAKTQPGRMNY